MENHATGLQLQSTVKKSGQVEISLARVAVPDPEADQILVRIEASPINPSDLGMLFGPADLNTLRVSGTAENPVVTADIAPSQMRALAARVDVPMQAGNEGAGLVVKAGASPEAQAMLGRRVSLVGGAMYAQYRARRAADCMVLPEGTSSAEGASWFVNPLTALGMVETMRLEGHTALAHTAAASNLGQMLVKICREDGVKLVNVVRSPAQAEILRKAGASYICDSSSATFLDDLTNMLAETGATIAFDAIGGGKLAGQLLSAMEVAANRSAKEFNRYGSTTHKQVYIYGALDSGPTQLTRSFGMAWGLGGWLLTPFLQKIGPAETQKLRQRVIAGLKTTFASHYTREVSLAEMLQPEAIQAYSKRATGEKFLVLPNKGMNE
ncbi:MAG TPA: zinc-binding dehydrogenase [Alphaproteobacteria bacterium]|nr:zinc-binding dehydrogenase [Alphaproteobacteria bacterium]